MHDLPQWHRANEQYLSEALRWVRARLRGLQCRRAGTSRGVSPDSDEQCARTAMDVAAKAGPSLCVLARRMVLSAFEENMLLLCAAMELDSAIAQECAAAQGNPSLAYPTFAMGMELFEHPTWDVLAPQRPLRRWNLLEIVRQPVTPLTRSPLRIDERVLNYIKGVNHLDERLMAVLHEVPNDNVETLSQSQQAVASSIVEAIRNRAQACDVTCPLIQLLGTHQASKRLVAGVVASDLDMHLHELSLDGHAMSDELDQLVRLLDRETRLGRVAVYADVDDAELMVHRVLALLRRRADTPVFVSSTERHHSLPADVAVDIEKPTAAEQHVAWRSILPDAHENTAALLAGQFHLDGATIHRIATDYGVLANPESIEPDALWDACRDSLRPRLDELAQRIHSNASFDDLVLPQEEKATLRQICNHVRRRQRVLDEWGFRDRINRGLGTTVLLHGESGVGKSYAASAIANELRLDLYRIDLSRIVDKYIGETSKHIKRIFDACQDGGCALLFDEADSLFGARSHVKDSHDRYANQEVSYLLTRMESYPGLAILTTNFKSALDSAFLRRLRFVVQLPFPEAAQRREIWERVFPAATPLSPLNYQRLGALHINGGNIHNIAVNAAFAAADGATVDMPVLLESARAEFVKMQKPVNVADFQPEPAGADL